MKTRLLLSMAWLMCLSSTVAAEPAKRPNVLFIAVDDLNHWVGYLGRNPQTITPNIDRLAARGVRFTRSYCAAPVCNPSRAALMSGLRPFTTGVYENDDDWRTVDLARSAPSTTTFRQAGYYTAGAGKIYHEAYPRRTEWDDYLESAGTDPAPGRRHGRGRHQVRAARLPRRGLARVENRRLRHRPIEEEARQAVSSHDRPAQAAHALERAAQVLRHASARQDRAAARPGRRPGRHSARGRADGQGPTATIARSSSRAAGRTPCKATWPRSRMPTQ